MKSLVLCAAIATVMLCPWSFAQTGWYRQDASAVLPRPLPTLYAVAFSDANTGTAVGAGGTIIHTTDGGTTWERQTSGTKCYLWGVSLRTDLDGIVVGDSGTILRTTNGGATWLPVFSGTTNSLRAVAMTRSGSGAAVGSGQLSYATIVRTSDGGASWAVKNVDYLYPAGMKSISFSDPSTAAAVGGWQLLRTTDQGTTWTKKYLDPLEQMRSICFAPTTSLTGARHAWIVGGDIVYDWTHILAPELSGTTRLILHSSDGGTTWYEQLRGSVLAQDWPLNSVWFPNSDTGFAVGKSGSILSTTNGGKTWVPQSSGTTFELNAVFFTDGLRGTLVGGGGMILRTTTGGVLTSVDNNPDPDCRWVDLFVLLQNYPNPFNPSTTIRYGLPQRSHVSLAVYNTLGQRVDQLIDGEVEAGSHEVKFDASNLPSGVYLYRLQAGNYVATRKLLLVK